MMWKHCDLTKPRKVEDELGNLVDTIDVDVIASTQARFSPWNTQQILCDQRGMTKTEQQFAIPLSYDIVKHAENAVMDDVNYEIKSVTDVSPRWCVITVGVYKR